MGDRVSVQFERGGERSVAFFAHWGGTDFPKTALQYAKDLMNDMKRGGHGMTWPLSRYEPNTVMMDFVRHLAVTGRWSRPSGSKMGQELGNRVMSSDYFGKDENDGDNSDNGNYVINLDGDKPVMRRE